MIDIFDHLSPRELLECLDRVSLNNLYYYKPTDKMLVYYAAGINARERMILGGNRTGKTYGVLIELYFHLTGLYPDWWPGYRFNRPINALEASISAELTRDILQANLFKGSIDGSIPPIIQENMIVHKTNINLPGAYGTVAIRHVSGGVSNLYLKAYKQGASSFQGVKFDWIHLDESVGYDVYQESLMRSASFDTNTRTLLNVTMWPEKGKDETVCHFMHRSRNEDGTDSYIDPCEIFNERFYMHIGWDDNPYLPEDEKKRLELSIPAWQLQARKDGLPVYGQGKVFIQPESELIIEPFDVSQSKYSHFSYIYGLDPAVTSGGTWGFVLLAYDRDTDTVYVQKDYKLSNATPTEHASNISKIIPFYNCPGMSDPAGAGENQHAKESTLEFLQNTSGLNITKAIKANGTKEAVIDSIYERIRRGKFKIMFDPKTNMGCSRLMAEWREYSRDEKGRIIKKNDHCIDALFYAYNGLHNAQSKNYSIYQNEGYGRATYV